MNRCERRAWLPILKGINLQFIIKLVHASKLNKITSFIVLKYVLVVQISSLLHFQRSPNKLIDKTQIDRSNRLNDPNLIFVSVIIPLNHGLILFGLSLRNIETISAERSEVKSIYSTEFWFFYRNQLPKFI